MKRLDIAIIKIMPLLSFSNVSIFYFKSLFCFNWIIVKLFRYLLFIPQDQIYLDRALAFACRSNVVASVKLILEQGANPLQTFGSVRTHNHKLYIDISL